MRDIPLTSLQILAAKIAKNSKEIAMRGSRPGERRGGRKKGTPNKKTAYVRAVMAAHAASPKVTPIDVALAVMRDPHVALEMRVKTALKALPHLHLKLRAGESASVGGDQSLAARRRKNSFPGCAARQGAVDRRLSQ